MTYQARLAVYFAATGERPPMTDWLAWQYLAIRLRCGEPVACRALLNDPTLIWC